MRFFNFKIRLGCGYMFLNLGQNKNNKNLYAVDAAHKQSTCRKIAF